jgi:hypothetical protein
MKMKLEDSVIISVVQFMKGAPAGKFSRPSVCSHTPQFGPMDPRDLELINDLLEGEANLREVTDLSSYIVL